MSDIARSRFLILSAAVVIQAPKSDFAQSALGGMSIVCDLAAAAREGCRAKKGLKTLLKLRQRARDAIDGVPLIQPTDVIDSPEGIIELAKRETNATTPMYGSTPSHGTDNTPIAFWNLSDVAPDDLGFNIDDFLNEIQENKLEIVV